MDAATPMAEAEIFGDDSVVVELCSSTLCTNRASSVLSCRAWRSPRGMERNCSKTNEAHRFDKFDSSDLILFDLQDMLLELVDMGSFPK